MSEENGYRFKTFSGVYLPSLLTIIGVVLFMRLGTIVGALGVSGALGILLAAESIAIATGLSISAISTNTKVENGGPYFLISRSLGTGFGTSIGLTYYVSQALSIPFYIIGFSEAIICDFPALGNFPLLVNFIPLIVLFIIAFIGANWAIKTQYFIFAMLVLSISAIFAGGFAHAPTLARLVGNSGAAAGIRIDLLTLAGYFAIFFPAVTGFLAGVNMSGDLENPRRSIPVGTMAAIATGVLIYATVIILIGSVFPQESLMADAYKTLRNGTIAHTGFLIMLGVVAATLSSALGTMVGAPRILQAFAADKIFPSLNFFAYGRGKSHEPVVAMILTFLISALTILWSTFSARRSGGNALNAVAELVTMFTLSTYAIINIAAAVEAFAANPSFRPRFHLYHWLIGVYGAFASIIVALFINAQLMLIAFTAVGILFFIARRRTLNATFGDARRGYYFEHIRRALAHLANMPADAKNWRPQFLILVGGEAKHLDLIRCASLLNDNRGILSVGHILVNHARTEESAAKRRAAIRRLENFSRQSGILFFPTVVVVPDENAHDYALMALLQAREFGPLSPNIVLSGWPSHADRVAAFGNRLEIISRLKMNSLIYFSAEKNSFQTGKTIDVWWRGRRNGALMLLLAHLLNCHWEFRKKTIRLLRLIAPENEKNARCEMTQLTEDARISAEITIITSDEKFPAIFRQYSGSAAVVFLGFVPPEEGNARNVYAATEAMLRSMPATFLVSSAGDTDIDS